MGIMTSMRAIWSINMQRIKGISIITKSMSIGDQSRETIRFVSSVVAPVNANNWLNIREDAMISNIMLVMKAEGVAECANLLRRSWPWPVGAASCPA